MTSFLFLPSIPTFAQPPAGYYDTVDTTSSTSLRTTLHQVIDDHTRFPYTASTTDTWDILNLADEDPGDTGRIIDVYKNASYAKISGGVGAYNREHTWPRSYGFPNDSSTNYPFSDCHHLFVADASYNGSRSNKPFRNCDSSCAENTTDFNDGRGGGSGVYPGNSNWTTGSFTQGTWETWGGRKGDVARAILYMDIRYEGGTHGVTGAAEPDLIVTDDENLIDNGNTGNNESVAYMGMRSVLLQWHFQDPVDARELYRNEVVFMFQGNRNPFIDHPEWVDCLYNGNCSGAPDTVPPAAPSNLAATASNARIDLAWNPNSEGDLAGYNVHRSTTAGGPYTKLNNTLLGSPSFTDTGLTNGVTYFYVVTAVDISGNISTDSNEASATPEGGGGPGGPGDVILSEVLYDVSGTDDGLEWVELFNPGTTAVDLSGYSLGNGGLDYTTSLVQLSGTIAPGATFVVGGPTSNSTNANPTFDLSINFNPDFQNSGSAGDGVALFDVPASQVTASTVPIDAVIYGPNNNSGLIDETGVANAPEIGDASSGSSLERVDLQGNWQIQATPTPNNTTLEGGGPGGPGQVILSEVLYDVSGTDDGLEWVELFNPGTTAVDLSGYSLGNGGLDYTTSLVQLSGTIAPGATFVVGGPTSNSTNANPSFDLTINFSPDFQNSGSAGDGVALFDVPASQVTASTVPIDAVIYGPNNNSGLIDETGVANAPEVGDASSGSSLERVDLQGNWQIQAAPTPNNTTLEGGGPGGPGQVILSEVLYDVSGTDDGLEWVELFNPGTTAVDLSGYSLGNGGLDYTTSLVQLSGTIAPGATFVVGGPTSSSANANPTFDLSINFNPDFQNSGSAGDGVALFDVPASQVTASTVPIDAVIYGPNNNSGLIDETGVANAPEVGDASSGSSLERVDLQGNWQIQATPTPNNTTLGGGGVNQAPSAAISSPADGSVFDAGQVINFAGSASDPEDGDLTAGLVWTSDLDGTIGNGGSFSTTTLSTGSHQITASVTDSGGLTADAVIGLTVEAADPVAITFLSIGSEDGWVRESGENTGVGSNFNSTGTGGSALRPGDNRRDRQYKSILSFDTSAIPDGATIVSATLRLQRGNVVGTNPFQTHRNLQVDINTGGFGGNNALEASDFQAAATATQVATLSNAPANLDWSEGALNADGLQAIHLQGRTQLRIEFELDDNDDNGNDYIGYYSGDNSNTDRHPHLVVVYQP